MNSKSIFCIKQSDRAIRISAPKFVVIIALLFASSFTTVLKAQDTLVVDASSVIGPAMQRGVGFLCGFSGDTVIPDSLLLPLKPNLLRCNLSVISSAYDRAKAMDCKLEIMLNVGWNKSNVPGKNGNWEPWLDHVTSWAQECIDYGMTDVHWCIWNDPDIPNNWQSSDEQFFECWKRTYMKIRELIPEAVIVGPASTWPLANQCKWWSDHKGDYLWYLRTFLDFCIENEVVPDIVSTHNWAGNGKSIERDAEDLRNYFISKDMEPLPFEQDDIGPSNGQFRPGVFVSYFASIERAKVAYTAKCCWDRDCFSNTLNGLLTKGSRQKRSLWWAHKVYADISGDILNVSGGTNVDGVAGVDQDTIRLVVGRHTNKGSQVVVHLKNTEHLNLENIKVEKQIIPNSEDAALPSLMAPKVQAFSVSDEGVFITINDLDDYEVCNLLITKATSSTGEFVFASRSKVYPNPVSQTINFEVDLSNRVYDIVIYNLSGKKVAGKYKCSTKLVQMNCEGLKKGTYLYRIVSNNELFDNGKIVIE